MKFNALVVEKNEEDGKTRPSVQELEISQLPDGEVLVNID